MRWWSVSLLSIGAEYIWGFRCSHSQEYKGLRSTCCWAVPQKLFLDIYCYELFPSFGVGEPTPEICRTILDTPCIIDIFIVWAMLNASCKSLLKSQKLKPKNTLYSSASSLRVSFNSFPFPLLTLTCVTLKREIELHLYTSGGTVLNIP
jgi:hypothetical protein